MKLTLIKPNIGRQEDYLYIDNGRMEPLQLGVLAGMTPEDIDVVMYDDRMEEVPFDEPTDLVGITVEVYTARRAYEIAAEYRRRGVPVIMGGFHPTLAPEEVAPFCDSIVTGDAGWIWEDVINDFRTHGKLKKLYKSKVGAPQANKYFPKREIFKDKGYLDIGLIQFGRGCKFTCSFCAISVFFDRQQFTRDLSQVIEEMKQSGKKMFFFVDDNICADFEALKELCRALIPLKIHWVSQGSMDMTKDKELMGLLVKSGCLGNVIGFETINPSNMKQVKKAPNTKGARYKQYAKEIQVLRDFGIQTWAAFTLGYDHDTIESIQETVDYAISNKFCFAAFNILMPYPNTPLYRDLEKQGRLLFDGKWWLHPEYRFNHAAFIPKNMTPDELTKACLDAKIQWNSLNSVFKRFFDFKTHMRSLANAYMYWKYNPIYRSENAQKQGMAFGKYNHIYRGNELKHKNDDIMLNPYLNNIKELSSFYKNFELI